MERKVDLRSDTVTLPSPAMREAMYRAEVGDDVYGEDPTVNRLEEMAAERLGKEAALFVVSGTMGNLVSVLTHCGRGDEVILGDEAHIFRYEAGGVSALGGIVVHTVPNLPDGMLHPADVAKAFRARENIHFPHTQLICLENTHNRCGGRVQTVEQMASIKSLAQRLGLAVHLDGARVFNAATALGVNVREVAAQADTVQFCFSKGLGAPVGSAICGSREFIAAARRTRKMVGGGMRQAGILAAACIVALEQMVGRLADDHANAKRLAQGLAELPGLSVDVAAVQTNIVMINVIAEHLHGPQVAAALTAEGMLVNAMDARRVRAVTHYGIEADDIDWALAAARRAVKEAHLMRRGAALGVDPWVLVLVVVGLGLATVLLDQGVRLALLWVTMALVSLAAINRVPQHEGLALTDMGRGALIGLVAAAPFAVLLADPLKSFSERLFATDNALLLFYQAGVAAPLAEELLFRGVLQPAKGIWLAALAYAGMALLYFAPHAPILVALIMCGTMFVLGVVYGHTRKQYGLAAAMACHAVAAFMLHVVPTIAETWQAWLS